MKIAGYVLGLLFIAWGYHLLFGESYLKSLAITAMLSWLSYLHFHFLGMIKYEKERK